MTLDAILLAVGPGDSDRIEQLSETVTEITRPTDAEVVILHAFTEDELETAASRLDFEPDDVSPEAVANRHKTVQEFSRRFDDAGVDHSVTAQVGDHADVIVAVAEEVKADRVIVGGRERSPAGKAVFGSTSQQVLLEAPSPVTLVK